MLRFDFHLFDQFFVNVIFLSLKKEKIWTQQYFLFFILFRLEHFFLFYLNFLFPPPTLNLTQNVPRTRK